jgi:hypothetical protein
MTLDIERLAREAGLMYHIPFPSDSGVTVALHRFASLVLENAAMVAETEKDANELFSLALSSCAAAIRALKGEK